MSNFDINFGPWINYGNANKSDDIGFKMQQLTTRVWSPFNEQTMANVFIFCMAYAFAKKREPKSPPGSGSMPASAFDQDMRDQMKFVAIASKHDLDVITNANEVVKICEGYAYVGLPEVYDKILNRKSSITAETILESLIKEVSSDSTKTSENDGDKTNSSD